MEDNFRPSDSNKEGLVCKMREIAVSEHEEVKQKFAQFFLLQISTSSSRESDSFRLMMRSTLLRFRNFYLIFLANFI